MFAPGSARADEGSTPVAAAAAPEKDKAKPACACECACKDKDGDADKEKDSGDAPRCGCPDKKRSGWVMGGLRASMTSLSGSDHDTTRVSLLFAGSGDWFSDGGGSYVNLHYAIGGGSAGFEGALGGATLVGYRVDLGKHHGPFARGGFEGHMMGNDLFWHSSLELPAMRVGYNYTHDGTVLELGARGGPVLAGRYNPGDAGYRRLSGSFEYGAYAFARTDHVRMSIMAQRFDAYATGDGTPVDMATGMLCVGSSKVALCADGRVLRGNVMQDGGGPHYLAQTSYGGLSFSWTTDP